MRRLLFVLLFASACQASGDAGRLRLADGHRISELAGPDSTAILLYDPGHCFSCGTTLPDWMAWRRAHPAQVRLVLTRSPSPGEARQLRAGRVTVDGVAPGAAPLVEGRASVVIVLVQGREAWRGAAAPAQLFPTRSRRQP